jgi:predicted Zn-dependent peptidase
VIWSELINLKKSVTQEEVSIAHDHLIGELHLQKESTVYLAREAAYQELFFGKVMSIENVEKAIKKVTLADIKRMSGRIFKKSLLNAVVISNKSINLK